MSDLEPNDIQRGRAEAVALEPILATAPRGRTQGVSLTKAATALLALARLVRDQGWRPRFERPSKTGRSPTSTSSRRAPSPSTSCCETWRPPRQAPQDLASR
jgi:hypothetical protein